MRIKNLVCAGGFLFASLIAVTVFGQAQIPCKGNGGTYECTTPRQGSYTYRPGFAGVGYCAQPVQAHNYDSEPPAIAEAEAMVACWAVWANPLGSCGHTVDFTAGYTVEATCGGIETQGSRPFAGTVIYQWTNPTPCSRASTEFGQIGRTSGPVCTVGWRLNLTCGIDTQVCYRESKKEAACFGNPCVPNSGAKLEFATDYLGAGPFPLEIKRTYNSQRFYQPVKVPAVGTGMGHFWRLSYHRRVIVGAEPTPMAYVIHADGDYRDFKLAGGTWVGRTDSPERLVEQKDAGGTRTGWQYSFGSDEAGQFDATGRLTSLTNRSGLIQTLTYDTSGRLAAVADSFGRQLSFTYNLEGMLSAITDPQGHSYVYAYNANGDLASVTHSDQSVRAYLYELSGQTPPDARHLLTGIVDENGQRFATYQYDANGRMSAEWNAGQANSRAITYTLDGGNEIVAATVTDAMGTARTYSFATTNGVSKDAAISQPCPGCSGNSYKGIAYDASGNVSSRTDFNDKKVCYAYDLSRNLETSRVEGILASETCATALATPPNRPDVRRVTTTWHATYRLPAAISEPAPGGTRTTTYTYDAGGNLTQRTIVAPRNDGTSATVTRSWSWTYGSLGRVATATDPNGRVTTYAYFADSHANLGNRGNLQAITNPLGHVTQVAAYDAGGRPQSTVDPNGLVTTLAYDLRGRLTERNAGGEVTSYVYDGAGQLTGVVMPDSSTLTYAYDAAHRLVRIQDGLGSRIEYTLDAAGNRTQERVYDPGGTLARTRSRVFDALNRLAQDLGAQGQATAYTYDGNSNATTTTDPLARTTTHAYDALNRLTQVLDPAGGITQYGYDAGGNLAQVTDPRGLATTYTYDGLGNLVTQVSPDTGSTASTFDAAGNVVTRTDARGATASYTVDALSRVTTTVFSRSGTPSETHTFSYDAGANALGRLTQLVDPAATTAWTYTPHGRVASKTQTTAGVGHALAYGYNAAGQLTTLTTPSGQQIGYGYLNGRIVAVTVNGTPLASGIVTVPFGPVGAWQWGNSRYTFRDYDQDGRLTRWTYRNGADLLRNDLAFDAASRITGIADPLAPAGSGAYQYDALDRLTVAQQGSPIAHTFEYGYDPLGNRTSGTADGAATSLYYGSNTHRLQGMAGAIPASYLNGLASVSFVYSNANRLVEVQSGATIASYTVNGLGQRVSKTVGVTTTRFVYDERGRLLGEYDGTGQLIQETVWLDDLPLATLRPMGTGNRTPIAIYYVHADHLGTPRAITRPGDDAIVWRWDNAEPFGNSAVDENPSGLGTFAYHLRFPGQYYDAEIGTHYNYRRDYDSATGRYVQSDPIGIGSGVNTYAYVWANPISAFDPKGLAGCWYTIGGKIACVPNDGGVPAVVPASQVHSGIDGCKDNPACVDRKNEGPVPPGCYRLTQHESKPDFWRLTPVGWDKADSIMCRLGIKRCGFQLHMGTISLGCITVSREAAGIYNRIDSMLKADAPENTLCVGTE